MSATDNTTIVGVRIDKGLLKRVEGATRDMGKIIPTFSRTQMIHLLLIKGLEAHEQESRQDQSESKRG